jgi:hypothetical protein
MFESKKAGADKHLAIRRSDRFDRDANRPTQPAKKSVLSAHQWRDLATTQS